MSIGVKRMEKQIFERIPIVKVFPCDCYGEGVALTIEDDSYFEEYGTANGGPFVNLAFWHSGHFSNKLSWRNRLAYIWHILRTGSPWCDMVILNGPTAKRLANHLYYLIDKYNANSQKDALKTLKD